MRSICVFCGSSTGKDPIYRAAAVELGTLLAERGIHLVYGGGSIGLMGVLVDAVLDSGGTVTGVIPESLEVREVGHPSVTEMHVVSDMHARKALMFKLSDGLIAMPGGYGTFEELLEVLTWRQLGLHKKSIGLLNVGGYFNVLLQFFDQAVDEGFVKEKNRGLLFTSDTVHDVLNQMSGREASA